MVQCLRTLAAFAEHLGFVARIHVKELTTSFK